MKMTTDPIADLLTRIRNASKARLDVLTLPHSRTKADILKVLQERGFISEFSEVKNGDFKELKVTLKERAFPLSLKRISKPGQRIYVKNTETRKVNGGLGLAIISTPKGVMSGEQARKLKLGGELICEVF